MNEIITRLYGGERLKDILSSSEEVSKFYKENPYPSLSRRCGLELEFVAKYNRERIISAASQMGLRVVSVGHCGSSKFSYWTIKSDASIRCEVPAGYYDSSTEGLYSHEIVSPPMDDLFWKDLSKLESLAKKQVVGKNGKTFDLFQLNDSCSLHIHLDMRGASHEQRMFVMKTYRAVETTLLDIIPDHRLNPDKGGKYASVIGSRNYAELIEAGKYNALRIKGEDTDTYEFRIMSATKNAWTMRCWILLLDSIIQYGLGCKQLPPDMLNLFDVVKSPILWNFFNSRKKFLLEVAKIDKVTIDLPARNEGVIRRQKR